MHNISFVAQKSGSSGALRTWCPWAICLPTVGKHPPVLSEAVCIGCGIGELCRSRCGYKEVKIAIDMTQKPHGTVVGRRNQYSEPSKDKKSSRSKPLKQDLFLEYVSKGLKTC